MCLLVTVLFRVRLAHKEFRLLQNEGSDVSEGTKRGVKRSISPVNEDNSSIKQARKEQVRLKSVCLSVFLLL